MGGKKRAAAAKRLNRKNQAPPPAPQAADPKTAALRSSAEPWGASPEPWGAFLVRLFPILALVLGLAYAVLLGPLQAPDEYGHFYRAYLLSEGTCIVPAKASVPKSVRELLVNTTLKADWKRPLHPEIRYPIGIMAVDTYTCVPYLAPATAMLAGRWFGGSAVQLMYLGRLANVILYAAIVTLALSILPGFRLLLFTVALMPMALHQAASLSADSLTIGITFLFTAYVAFLAFGPVPKIEPRHYMIAAGLAVLLMLSKSNAWMLPATLLIPAARFQSRGRWAAFIVLVVAMGLGATGLWGIVNKYNVVEGLESRKLHDVDFERNMQFVQEHPAAYSHSFYRTITTHGRDYAVEFIGDLGSLEVPLPIELVIIYVTLLVGAAMVSAGPARLRNWDRALLAGIAVLSFVSTYILLWGLEARGSDITEAFAGVGFSPGVQGRYFIPFSFISFITLGANLRFRLNSRLFPHLPVAATSGMVLIANLTALFLCARYYSTPGVSQDRAHPRYEGMILRCPGSTPEQGKVYVIWNGQKRWVLNGQWLRQNGFRDDELVSISCQDLKAIPLGPAILPASLEIAPPRKSDHSTYEHRLIRSASVAENGKVYIVLRGSKHWIQDERWITARGFRPADVQIISDAELNGIPAGAPIPPVPPE